MKQIESKYQSEFVEELTNSYAAKRELHKEFTDMMMVRGFDYTKKVFVSEKFPKFPKRLREVIETNI